MLIAQRLIGKTWFEMCLIEIDGSLDITFSCENWCSGYLKAQNPEWSLEDIQDAFWNSNLNGWADSAWEDYGERQLWG